MIEDPIAKSRLGHAIAESLRPKGLRTTVEGMKRRKGRAKADIASRRSSKHREFSGEFLEGTESSVTNIEPTAASGFREAWERNPDPGADESLDSAIDVGQDDSKSRDLNRRRSGLILAALVLIAGVGAAVFFFSQERVEPEDPSATSQRNAEQNILGSPLDEREFSPLETPITVEVFERLNDQFVDADGDGELIAGGGESPFRGRYLAGTVFWAGRAHVVLVTNQPLLRSGECVISSLVTAELEAIDVASAGDCADAFTATGDRIACVGENILLLEVWPTNPDAVEEPRLVAGVRTRVEARDGTSVTSLRGAIDVSGFSPTAPFLASATPLSGAPGDTVTFNIGILSSECTLLDRSGVDIRLLPG